MPIRGTLVELAARLVREFPIDKKSLQAECRRSGMPIRGTLVELAARLDHEDGQRVLDVILARCDGRNRRSSAAAIKAARRLGLNTPEAVVPC